MTLRSLLPALGLAVIVVAGVAGCTEIGPDAAGSSSAAAAAPSAPAASTPAVASGQTKAQACSILSTSMETISKKLTSEYASFSSDPKAAVAAMQQLSDAFQANVAKVTEPGALALATKANADLTAFVADVKNAVAHPLTGVKAVQKAVPTLEADLTKVGTYCG